MSTRTRQIIRLLVRLSVAALLLAWVFSRVDVEQFRQTVRAARWHYLLGVWGFTALFFWLQALALRWILRRQECDVSTGVIFGASCVTSLYGLVLPGILSTGVKWYLLKRATGKGSNVLSAMLYNQVNLTVVMTAIGLLGLIVPNPARLLVPGAPAWVLPLAAGVLLIVLLLVAVLILNARTGGRAIDVLLRALRPFPETVRGAGQRVLTQLVVFQTAGWRFHLLIALVNALDGLLVGLLMYLCAARAADVPVSLGVLVWLCAIVFVLGKIPVSIANLGVREVTLMGLLAGYGVPRSAALLMSMILFSSLIFMAALGLVYQAVWAVQARNTVDTTDSHRPGE